MTEQVLVTGANGHVGYTLCQHLLAAGYRVRASIRDASDTTKAAPLIQLGCEVVGLDILDEAGFVSAMEGMSGAFHVAAVYRNISDNPEAEIVRPAVEGARNAIVAAARAGVRRLVLTSSTRAVGGTAPGGPARTENDWNDSATHAYARAKTVAERDAWSLAEQLDVDLVVVNPGMVLGPGFRRHTESTMMFQHLIDERFPMAPKWLMSTVDVRDVATAHRLAFETKSARGRHLVINEHATTFDMCGMARQIDPSLKAVKPLPKMMEGLLPLFDWLDCTIHRRPRALTLEFINEFRHHDERYDNAKARTELGWKPAFDLRTSITDTLAWICTHQPDRL